MNLIGPFVWKEKRNLSQNQSKSLCFLSILKQTSIFLNLITDWYAKSRTKRIKNGRNLFSKRRLRRNVWEMKWFFVWNIAHSYRIQRTPFWFVALRWVKVHAIDYLFLKIKTAEKNRIKSILKKNTDENSISIEIFAIFPMKLSSESSEGTIPLTPTAFYSLTLNICSKPMASGIIFQKKNYESIQFGYKLIIQWNSLESQVPKIILHIFNNGIKYT